MAGSLLFDYGLDPGLSTNALALVETVVQSDIWNRALKSHKVYTEIPFQLLLDKKNNPALTTIIRGVIDLIFLENNGWVLVDYKTDAVKSSKDLTRLKGIYTPQLSFYADTWEQITQDKVKEQGLYFISANKYEITSHRS